MCRDEAELILKTDVCLGFALFYHNLFQSFHINYRWSMQFSAMSCWDYYSCSTFTWTSFCSHAAFAGVVLVTKFCLDAWGYRFSFTVWEVHSCEQLYVHNYFSPWFTIFKTASFLVLCIPLAVFRTAAMELHSSFLYRLAETGGGMKEKDWSMKVAYTGFSFE